MHMIRVKPFTYRNIRFFIGTRVYKRLIIFMCFKELAICSLHKYKLKIYYIYLDIPVIRFTEYRFTLVNTTPLTEFSK